jgi:NAD(P)-dependent dehydrogenase (short-subunit alcohol dehydrogenase family)
VTGDPRHPGRNDSRVAVVTGASSGIGRATAHALAGAGMRLVLAARDAATLDLVVAECRSRGGEAVAVPTDVAAEGALQALADAAVDSFGGFDVWINDAAVMAYGTFEQVPPEVYRRVIEVNLFGPIEAARIAVPHFRERGGGHLINIGSLYAKMTSPLVGPYVVSKFGLLGFTEVLRQELHDEEDIRVSIVLPGSVDTPIFRHAANFSGREVRPVPPVTDVTRVAHSVRDLVERPRPVAVVGRVHHLMAWGRTLMPRVYARTAPPAMWAAGLRPEGASDGAGNVFEPEREWNQIRGGWGRRADLAAGLRAMRAVAAALIAPLTHRLRSGG